MVAMIRLTAMIELLNRNRQALETVCFRFGVARPEAFGSALPVEFKTMEPNARVDAYFGLLDKIRAMFQQDVHPVMVDAVRTTCISREIERTRQLLYAA